MDQDEKKLRQALGSKLGVEFCSDEDLGAEQKIAEMETSLPVKNIEVREERPQISVSDLIEKCNFAMSRMSNKNPHKHLFHMCASAIKQLADRLYQYEQKAKVH